MRHFLTVKYKIISMPIMALLALGALLFISRLFMGRNTNLLTGIEQSFVPALELGHAMDTTLADLQRGLQDAVASADQEELTATDVLAQNFLQLFEQAQANAFFQTAQLTALETEFERYYALARETSQRLIDDGIMDARTVADLKTMSEGYNAIKVQLQVMTTQAKSNVIRAFADTVRNHARSSTFMVAIMICGAVVMGSASVWLVRSISTPLYQAIQVANRFVEGQRQVRIPIQGHDEISHLGEALNRMMATIETEDWVKTGQVTLNEQMRGEQDLATLSQNIIGYLATYLDIPIGALYIATDDTSELRLTGSYAYNSRKGNRNVFKLGEGLIGQAALEKHPIIFSDVPENYVTIQSGLGEVQPRFLLVFPFLHEQTVKGVIELGTIKAFSGQQQRFIEQIADNLAIAVHSAQTRSKMRELLQETQKQANELQTQQEQLRISNEELEAQTDALRKSEQRLQHQQEELRQINEELAERSETLEKQQRTLQQKNIELENARQLVEDKARELERTNKYKSEFLANMSHELRTPLNSLLILSKLLSENKDGNLTTKQIEFAQIIHAGGTELLTLINEVLDLAKVESGKIELHLEDVRVEGLAEYMSQNFRHLAEKKGLNFSVHVADDVPAVIRTDRQRLEQIVKNLLSNAIKFTADGEVRVNISQPGLADVGPLASAASQRIVAIAVTDTGIGIPKEKHQSIFEAFQQADGTTSRKFGGTGLGLSIAREFARLLDGHIALESAEGQGSTFTIYLPETGPSSSGDALPTFPAVLAADQNARHASAQLPQSDDDFSGGTVSPDPRLNDWDDRQTDLTATDRILLIIEDDQKFAHIVLELVHERGFKGLVAGDGLTGLQLAYHYRPSAIILDIGLPGMDGWTVMEKLKHNPATRYIPVHVISALDRSFDARKMGAIGYLVKPASIEELHDAFHTIEAAIAKTIKKLLLVENDETTRDGMIELLHGNDLEIISASTGEEAWQQWQTQSFDCVVLDLGLDDMSGFELLERLHQPLGDAHVPVVVYTAQELTKKDEQRLKEYAESIVIKGAKSQERLLDEVALFLHRVESDLPEPQRQRLRMLHDKEAVLDGKIVLIVDDDMRNMFALSSVLEEKGMQVLMAEHGKEALALLERHPEIDIVLMDMMMPEMDGYESISRIRAQPQQRQIPIIALTAKAMKGDRQRCIDAGANDYLSKPVDVAKLLSLLRVWLY